MHGWQFDAQTDRYWQTHVETRDTHKYFTHILTLQIVDNDHTTDKTILKEN